jgi:hypothetical protein
MFLIQLVVILIVLGLVWWLVQSVLPIPAPFKTVILVVLTVIAILLLLAWAGLLGGHAGGLYLR